MKGVWLEYRGLSCGRKTLLYKHNSTIQLFQNTIIGKPILMLLFFSQYFNAPTDNRIQKAIFAFFVFAFVRSCH